MVGTAKSNLMTLVVALLTATAVWMPSAVAGDARAATRCTRESVEVLVRDFVRAYNTGDSQTLERAWAQEPDFQWYFVQDERGSGEAEKRSTLPAYFAMRHGLGDRLHLTDFRVGPPNDQGHFGIGFRLRRSSDDAAARGMWHGKASATEAASIPDVSDPTSLRTCTLVVWSMGKESRQRG